MSSFIVCRDHEAGAMSSFSLASNSTIKVQHRSTTFILEELTKTIFPSKLFFLFHTTMPSCFYQRRCLDAPASNCRLPRRISDALSHATYTNSKGISVSLARFRNGFTDRPWATESNRWSSKHPDERRILNQCKLQLVGNAARGCRMTNR